MDRCFGRHLWLAVILSFIHDEKSKIGYAKIEDWLRRMQSISMKSMQSISTKRSESMDQRIKADIKGLPHMATAPPPCRPGPRAQPGWSLVFPSTVSVVIASIPNDTFTPLAVIADLIRKSKIRRCGASQSPEPPEDYIPRRRFALWSKQACHPCNGLCGGMGSMAAAWPYLVYALLIPCM